MQYGGFDPIGARGSVRSPELGELSAPRQQFGGPATLDDQPVLQHHDDVGVGVRLRPVGDDQNRPITRQRRKRVAHSLFGLRVGEGGHLVEHKHGCVGEQWAGKRDPLRFPT